MTVLYIDEVRQIVRDCLGRTAWELLGEFEPSQKDAERLPVMAHGMALLEKTINTRLDELSKEDDGEE